MKFSFTKKSKKARHISFLLAILLAVSLLANHFIPSSSDVNKTFEQFTLSLFQQEVSANTINLHYTLENPEKYGVFNSPVTYGDFPTDKMSVLASVENCENLLKKIPYRKLSKENRLTYDVLKSHLQLQKEGGKYLLYEEPLNAITGIQTQLPVLLAEYSFSKKKDVDTYLQLLKETPDYFNSLIEFEKEKVEKGLFLSDKGVDSIIKQCESVISQGKKHYLYSTFRQRLENITFLTEKEKRKYLLENEKRLESNVFPSYDKLIRELKIMRGKGENSSGVCHFPNGKKYYQYKVKMETGSSRKISELKSLIQKQMTEDLLAMSQKGVGENVSATVFSLQKNTPQTYLKDLEKKITKVFPKIPKVETEIKFVPRDMEPYLSPAFYVIPCIDHTEKNVIYINRSHNMEKLHLYTTLAHEGYPGHLYQTTYFSSQNPNPIRSLLNFGGYVEGWATYAEMCSYYLTPMERKQAILEQKNSSLLLGLYARADIGIHYDGWSLRDTVYFFEKYGIKEEKTVEEIYELIVSTPANYLKYYIGYVEFLELKKDIAEKKGKAFSQRDFHQAVLDVGPAPFSIVRKYVLKEK
ncbi:DUF885 domain-containing protein [Faecalimonas sp.]